MPLIKTYEQDEATGELAEIYEQILSLRGNIGDNVKLFSISPELLKQQLEFIKFYMNHPTLSMPLLASIRILVSKTQECDFCIEYNTAMLINIFGWTKEQVDAMKEDVTKANLEQRDIKLIQFVLKSINDAHNINQNDMEELKKLQWREQDIFEAVNHATRMLSIDIVFNTFKI